MNWNFVPPDVNPKIKSYLPITLRAGDYNLDGYPDLVAVFRNSLQDG